MKDISRRDALSKIATSAAGFGLVAASGELVNAEHAYHMDYGAAAAKYVDAFLQNVNWEEVSRRTQTH